MRKAAEVIRTHIFNIGAYYQAKPARNEAHRRLMAALEQSSYADARRMLIELEAWLRTKNESAATSLREAFEELLTLHRLKVPVPSHRWSIALPRVRLRFRSLCRTSENMLSTGLVDMSVLRSRGVLLCCEQRFRKVKMSVENVLSRSMIIPDLHPC